MLVQQLFSCVFCDYVFIHRGGVFALIGGLFRSFCQLQLIFFAFASQLRSTDHLSSAKFLICIPSSCRCFVLVAPPLPADSWAPDCWVWFSLFISVADLVSMASSIASWASSSVDWGWTLQALFVSVIAHEEEETGRCFGIHARNV